MAAVVWATGYWAIAEPVANMSIELIQSWLHWMVLLSKPGSDAAGLMRSGHDVEGTCRSRGSKAQPCDLEHCGL